jgi:hypothetical protein
MTIFYRNLNLDILNINELVDKLFLFLENNKINEPFNLIISIDFNDSNKDLHPSVRVSKDIYLNENNKQEIIDILFMLYESFKIKKISNLYFVIIDKSLI